MYVVSHKQWLALTGATVALALLAMAFEPGLALAQSGLGNNLGDEVQSWGKALLPPVAGLMMFPALAKRDTGMALTTGLVSAVAGGFVYAPNEVKGVIDTLWSIPT